MFSYQMANVAGALRQLGMSEQLVSCFVDTLGNCQQAIEHRGPVTLSGPDPAPIGTPGITAGYAVNVDPGSSLNVQGDSQFAGDNLFTDTSVTDFEGEVNLHGDTTRLGINVSQKLSDLSQIQRPRLGVYGFYRKHLVA